MKTTDFDHEIRNFNVSPHPGVVQGKFKNMIFGVNAEITRRAFYGGLSAEMLNNRKLLTGDTSPAGWDCINCERVTDAPQRSLCNSHYVVLHGGSMAQSSEVISLREGCTYTAAIWIRACHSAVNVTFGVVGMEQTFRAETDEAPLSDAELYI